MGKRVRVSDMGRKGDLLVEIRSQDLMPIPAISANALQEPLSKGLTEDQKRELECSLDGFVAIGIPRPKSHQEEEAFVKKFLEGLKKLFEKENNWTFLQPLVHSMDYCVKCQLCSEACPSYVASGRK
jgi:ferredoxin